ncbi:MAG TPA: Flp family type IVb pilin [Tepidisphaeraceae bacterium]|nr:Flp family type IVb pilin [Tepidisphaeraceae bacterium]
MKAQIARLIRDEAGTETLEYALILGLILVGCITLVAGVGTKVLARWTSTNSSFK